MTRLPFGRSVPGNRWELARDDLAPHRTVSVVVTHFEQPAQLRRTLGALQRQTRPADQVVVSDDGSAVPPEAGPDVEVVAQHDDGFRAAAARNLGAARATGDLLVFLDADTTPEPAFLERITRLPSRLPELLAVGRRRHADLSAIGADVPVEQAGPRHELAEPGWLLRGYAGTSDLRHADATSHRFVISSVLACSRWWFEELGGFDERFVGYGGEDWELAARSWRGGGLVAHVPDAVAWHDGPAVGEAGRQTGSTDHAVLDQTLALAGRVGAPGATYRGLLLGPVDLVVTADPGLHREALTVTLDSLLTALPRCRVALPDPAASWFADDPRVVRTPPSAPVTEPSESTAAEPERSSVAETGRPVVEAEGLEAQPGRPEAEPARPVAEPGGPVAEPGGPVGEPEGPVGEPEGPVGEPARPVGEPARPVGEPARPVAEAERLAAEPEGPEAEPERPVVEPVRPMAETERPVVAPERPVVEPAGSSVAEPERSSVAEPERSSVAEPERPVVEPGGAPAPTVSKPPAPISGLHPAPPNLWLDQDHRLHLHLTTPVIGTPDAWTAVAGLADGVDPPASTWLQGPDGCVVGVLHDLRQHRRARRQAYPAADLLTTATSPVALRPADRVSLQGWLEGWA